MSSRRVCGEFSDASCTQRQLRISQGADGDRRPNTADVAAVPDRCLPLSASAGTPPPAVRRAALHEGQALHGGL